MSLPNVFNKTMGLKDVGESYNDLFNFKITMVVDVLKCEGQ